MIILAGMMPCPPPVAGLCEAGPPLAGAGRIGVADPDYDRKFRGQGPSHLLRLSDSSIRPSHFRTVIRKIGHGIVEPICGVVSTATSPSRVNGNGLPVAGSRGTGTSVIASSES